MQNQSKTEISDEKFQNPIFNPLKLEEPNFCVLVRVYGKQLSYFPLFALSLRLSGFNNIKIFAVNTDDHTDIVRLRKTVKFINDFVSETDFVKLLDLGPIPFMNQYGYGVTDQGLQYLYEQYERNSTICQYLLVTNGDNLYTKNFGKHVLRHMFNKVDIISWAFVSHHFKPGLRWKINQAANFAPVRIDDGTEKCSVPVFQKGVIDLGATAYRFEMLYRHKLFYRVGNRPFVMASDGEFIERVVRLTNNTVALGQTLFIHQ